MSQKFGKNREVSVGYCKVPMYYTGIKHPANSDKELVLMDAMGHKYTACWRNNRLCKVGIEFLVEATKNGFIFKGKEFSFGSKVI